MSNKTSKPATLAVDYTPEMTKALETVRTAATAFKAYVKRGDGTILPQCVEATRVSVLSGFLKDGRDKDGHPAAKNGKQYADMFGTDGAEVTFWKDLATAVEAGVTYGDDLWSALALTAKGSEGGARAWAKQADVKDVIRKGGSVDAIRKAVQDARAEHDRKATTRKARPAGGTGPDESAPEGIPTSQDPVADALLCILGLSEALSRVPVESVEDYLTIKAAWAKVGRDAAQKRAHAVKAYEAAKAAKTAKAKAAEKIPA